ncbi:MAG TPA: hypothetical protein VMV42_01415 [archaeon]|nr:hypothetical protein [archaeon]
MSQEQSHQQAALAQAQRANRERIEFRDHGVQMLREVSTELFERIREDAPAAKIRNIGTHDAPVIEAALGYGTLTMSVGHLKDLSQGAFPNSGWDVVCWDSIMVSQPDYRRSASLWYVNDGSGKWRWLEVAYFSWGSNFAEEPCALPPGRDADLAASNVTCSWNFAHPPREIEGDGREAFIERWIGHLASAAERRLTHPSPLPEA